MKTADDRAAEILALKYKLARAIDEKYTLLIDTIYRMIHDVMTRKGHYVFHMKNLDIVTIKFSLVSGQTDQVPVIRIDYEPFNSEDEVTFHVLAESTYFHLDRLEEAILFFMSYMLEVYGPSPVNSPKLLAGQQSIVNIEKSYVLDPLKRVCISFHRYNNQSHYEYIGIGITGNAQECAQIYYDDGRGDILVVYPSSYHAHFMKERMSHIVSGGSSAYSEVERGSLQDVLLKLPDGKLLTVANLKVMMLANYDMVINYDIVAEEIADMYLNDKPEIETAVITVEMAKRIQKAHGIKML